MTCRTMTSKTWFYRDLAARNCMISADKVVKVGDLGLARHVYMTDFYHTSSNVGLPIRWMAPESIADRFFTSQSDVWSFGVVLWEIATLAKLPFKNLSNDEVIASVEAGGHLDLPRDCPEIFRSMMLECWKFDPRGRPTFLDICRWGFLRKERKRKRFTT